MGRLLIIAYYFSPNLAVGTFRVASFHRYLKEFGWETHVVTATLDDYQKSLDSCVTRMPFSSHILQKILPFKDESWAWGNAAKVRLENIIHNNNPDIVLITGDPFLYFELGRWVKQKFGIPYILDFRDIFTYPDVKFSLRNAVARQLESRWVSEAGAILVPSERMRSLMKAPQSVPIYVIENGFDDVALANVLNSNQTERLSNNGILSFVYAGKFHIGEVTYRSPLNLLRVLKNSERYGLPPARLVHIGSPAEDVSLVTKAEELPLVELGLKDYSVALQTIREGDIGVIISSGWSFEATTKVYDYIALNKPILAVGVQEGWEIHSILQRYGRYQICDNTEAGIAKAIIRLNEQEKNAGSFSRSNLTQFGRRYQVSKLAKVLEFLVKKA